MKAKKVRASYNKRAIDHKDIPCYHRRRIYLEDKANVVSSDWGTESLPR